MIGVGLWRSAGGFFLGDWFGVWVIGIGLWCLVFDGLGFFFFFLVFMVDYGLVVVVVVVSSVCSAAMVVIVVVKQK